MWILKVALLSVVLLGCQERTLVSGVDQSEANKIVAVLFRAGITAEAASESGGRGKFKVLLDEAYYQEAVSIIDSKGLPDKNKSTLESIVNPSSLLPASRGVEALRNDYALSLQLAALIKRNPNISDVAVVVRTVEGESGVSISLVEERRDSISYDDLKALVAQVVPSVKVDRIAISRSLAPPQNSLTGRLVHTLFGVRLFQEEYPRFVILALAFLVIFGALGAMLGYLIGFRKGAEMEGSDLPVVWKERNDVFRVKGDGG